MAAPIVTSKKPGFIAAIALALVWLCFLVFQKSKMLTEPLNGLSESLPSKNSNRPLILYAYKETPNARENIEFFLDQGLHGAADFIFILNGDTDVAKLIPVKENIRVVQRPNTCFDLGAYGEVLRRDNLWKRYKHFITLNASLRGPFLPYWSNKCWSDAYLERVTDGVKLVGMTVNCTPRPHVQSMLWATDHIGMDILLNPPSNTTMEDGWGAANDPVAFAGCYTEMIKAVHAEIGATGAIRGSGYQVSAMMSAFDRDQEYFDHCDEHPNDMLYTGMYFGASIHPYETIFLKANRGIEPATMDLLTKLHMSKKPDRSWDLCK
ncbi:hypothetical protein F5Y15DRAFT_412935 [Xylariaceae sp. FL0016]|nr:hypothetical protein F5Y15DRAFT_412935 [Xylariaceae sp. FL0016]